MQRAISMCVPVYTHMYMYIHGCAHILTSVGYLKKGTSLRVHITHFALDCQESGKYWPYKNGSVTLLARVGNTSNLAAQHGWSLTRWRFQVDLPLQAYINVTGMLHFKIKKSGLISLF